ncbi:MAG: FAD-dependent oxidoreductase [Pirellulaceae bacterium]
MRSAIAMLVAVSWLSLATFTATPTPAQTVLVEAEQFADVGGWVNDSQFMDQMGSPFLLAHGLGVPVQDATTQIEFPSAGTYRVWVRTRDWVARWNAPGAPGRFQLLVDGAPLPVVFGTEGSEWHWQAGGHVEIQSGRRTRLSLHDLTGFEGRCDALIFSADGRFEPPNTPSELVDLRHRLLDLPERSDEAGPFDLVVVGGGMAGTCASVAAARLGLSVALIQDRPVLGGNNSSEVRVWLQGARNVAPHPRVGDIVAELEQQRSAHYGPGNTADLYEDAKKLDLVSAEKNLRLFLLHRVNDVETAGGRIEAVIAQHTATGRRVRLTGRWFADCTGDGCVGFLAGADYDMTAQGHMGRCNLWNVIETDRPRPFPRCPWALDLSDKPFPGRNKAGPRTDQLGGWFWESGFDHDPIERGEYIRDWNFRAMYGAWDALKNVDKALPNHQLNWAAHISGKRESRRLLGDVVLSKEDVLEGVEFQDGCVPTGWHFDLHLPSERYEEGFEGDAFASKAIFTRYELPYWIPYRCLYSRNVPNLFMAGRDISVTHDALGTVRVMRTGGCMGEIVGMAASVCKQHNTDPRSVYHDHLDDLKKLIDSGVGKPVPATVVKLEGLGANVALAAAVATSGDRDAARHPATLLNDGQAAWHRNDLRWLSSATVPNWVELRWDEPKTIAAARLLSGYNTGGAVEAPIAAFVLQVFEGGEWKDIPGTATTDNSETDWHRKFNPVTTSQVRLLVHATHINVSRIWEIELYERAP